MCVGEFVCWCGLGVGFGVGEFMKCLFVVFFIVLVLLLLGVFVGDVVLLIEYVLVYDLLVQMVGIDIIFEYGSIIVLVEVLVQCFLKVGFLVVDVQVVGDDLKWCNLVVCLCGQGQCVLILLLVYLDVVEVLLQDWYFLLFKFIEQGGYFYGCGMMDIKGGGVGFIVMLLCFKQEGFKLKGDYIFVFIVGEEDGKFNGVQWLLVYWLELICLQYLINVDGGGLEICYGWIEVVVVEIVEKVYVSYMLIVCNFGGYSLLLMLDNVIYLFVVGLMWLLQFDFLLYINFVMCGYYVWLVMFYIGQMVVDMCVVVYDLLVLVVMQWLVVFSLYNNVYLCIICVLILLVGGDVENVLLQMVCVMVNCCILLDEDLVVVQVKIIQVLVDLQIVVVLVVFVLVSLFSLIDKVLFVQIVQMVKDVWGQVMLVLLYMLVGVLDSVFLCVVGMLLYVFNGIFYDVDDDCLYGQDECILVDFYYWLFDFNYRLLKNL